ncbi:MAG TPA: hypothetical protein VNS09_17985 [Solirubrobacter sp.]|nr:hypothetical protein [Solirubrobacter sp.]
MPPTAALSVELRTAAEAERAIVADRVAELRAQAQRLHDLADAADADLASSLRLLHQLDEMLGLSPQMSIADVDEELRGQRLRYDQKLWMRPMKKAAYLPG